MLVASFVLGFMNIIVMGLAFRNRTVLASVLCLLIQIPWTVYDIATHQYGFLLITAGSVFVAGPALIKALRHRLYTEGMSELDETTPAPAPVDALRDEATAWAVANPPSRVLATIVLGLVSGVAWVIGRTWITLAGAVRFFALAVKHGYRKGSNAPVSKKGQQAPRAPQAVNYVRRG